MTIENIYKSECGTVNVSTSVIKHVIGIAMAEIANLNTTAKGLKEEFFSIFRGRDTDGIRVEFEGESCSIDIYVSVKYGVKIPQLARKVQKNIKDKVKSITNFDVSAVNVYVVDLELPKEHEIKEYD